MAKRTTPRYEPEPQPAEATNDDVLVAIRRVEKTLVAMTKDIADIAGDIDTLHTAIPKAQIPPNDGPAPPELVVEPLPAEAAPAQAAS